MHYRLGSVACIGGAIVGVVGCFEPRAHTTTSHPEGASEPRYRATLPSPRRSLPQREASGSRPQADVLQEPDLDAPWLQRDLDAIPTSSELLEDARYVCDSKCTDDALVAAVEQCKLIAKVKMRSRTLSVAQLELLTLMTNADGTIAGAVTPQVLRGGDKEILGFAYFEVDEVLLDRQRKGYSGTAEDRGVWIQRSWQWSTDVCRGTLAAQ